MRHSHRAIGGLVSLVAIVVVFGIATTAFLTINSQMLQTNLTSNKINQLQNKKGDETLVFNVTDCQRFDDSAIANVTMQVNNTWAQNSILDSVLLSYPAGTDGADQKNVTGAKYVNGSFTNKTVPSLASRTVKVQNMTIEDSTTNATIASIVSELGNKFRDKHDFATCS